MEIFKQRRMEWRIEGDGNMGYSRPTTYAEHLSFVQSLRMRGQLGDESLKVAQEKLTAQSMRQAVRRIPLSEDSIEYFYASLILEGLSETEINVRLREVGAKKYITPK